LSLDFVLDDFDSYWRLRGVLFRFIFRSIDLRFKVLLVKLHLGFLDVEDFLAGDDIPDERVLLEPT
jgi:hypothetical protein